MEGISVRWICEHESLLQVPHTAIDGWEVAENLANVCRHFGIEVGDGGQGSPESRSRYWSKQWNDLTADRFEDIDRSEFSIFPREEFYFQRPLPLILAELRRAILNSSNVVFQTDVTSLDIKKNGDDWTILSSGNSPWSGSKVAVTDSNWARVLGWGSAWTRLKPRPALQLHWEHGTQVGELLRNDIANYQTMVIPLGHDSQESGTKHLRHAMGWFSDEYSRSVWTSILTSEEAEDNHAIVKRIRKLKQAFAKVSGLPEAAVAEHVHFIPEFAVNSFSPKVTLENGMIWRSDALGWSKAWSACAHRTAGAKSQTKKTDALEPTASL